MNENEIMNNEVMDTEIEATQADENSGVGIGYIVGGLVTVGLAAWKLVDLGKGAAKKIKAKVAERKAAKEAAVDDEEDFVDEIVEEEK